MTYKAEPQERFNWGFHDGAHDGARRKLAPWHGRAHYDRLYAQGYRIGWQTAFHGEPTDNSLAAWKSRPSLR